MTRMQWAAWVVAVFAMHFIWEISQAKWFISMTGMPFWQATYVCFRATLGDLVITALAFGAAAAVARRIEWPRKRAIIPCLVFVTTGILITAGFEVFALRTGRWNYGPGMPTVFGIGALPLAQWIVIPLLEVPLFRWLWRVSR